LIDTLLGPERSSGYHQRDSCSKLAFLSHDWGLNEDNHHVVKRIHDELLQLGIDTWLDDEEMEGDTSDCMIKGIDQCPIVLVFVTERYRDKTGPNSSMLDNCKCELRYGLKSKADGYVIPVVLERSMLNQRLWIHSQLAFNLGNSLYVNLTFPVGSIEYNRSLNGLAEMIRRKIVV
jgi:hypothetical protein